MDNEFEYKIINIFNIKNLFIMRVIFHITFLLVFPSIKNLHIRVCLKTLLLIRINTLSNCTYCTGCPPSTYCFQFIFFLDIVTKLTVYHTLQASSSTYRSFLNSGCIVKAMPYIFYDYLNFYENTIAKFRVFWLFKIIRSILYWLFLRGKFS
jgi:hypothetical protein